MASNAERGARPVRFCLIFLWLLIFDFGFSNASFSQTPSASQLTPQTLRPLPAPAIGGIAVPEAAPQDVPAGAAALHVLIRDIALDGGFPELADEVHQLSAPMRGQRVTVAELFAFAAAVEQAYARAGYVLVRVVVPAQKLVDGGVFRLTVIDGYIEAVDGSRLPERVRSVVEARAARLVGQRRVTLAMIERQVLLAGDVPGLSLRSSLVRGDDPGGTRLVLEGTHRWVQGSVGVDNRLSEENGRWLFTASAALNSVLGQGEQVYGTVAGSDDLKQVLEGRSPLRFWGVGAVIPVGTDGFTLNPEYTVSRSRPRVDPVFLQSEDHFERFAVRASYPLILTRSRTLRATAAYEYIEQTSTAVDFAVDLSRDRYSVLRGGLEGATLTPWGASVMASVTVSRGLGGRSAADAAASDVPLSRQGAGPVFTKLVAEARYGQPLAEGLQLSLLGRAQTPFGDPLLKPEQLSLDSADILSGFASGTFSVDSGVVGRIELSRPVDVRLDHVSSVVTPYLFAAAGRGWLEEPTAVERRSTTAHSFGGGVRGLIAGPDGWPGASLQLEAARVSSDDPNVADETRATFSASLRF